MIYLFTLLFICGVVGHIMDVNFSKSGKSVNPGKLSDILANIVGRVLLKVLHSTIKCCSVPIGFFADI